MRIMGTEGYWANMMHNGNESKQYILYKLVIQGRDGPLRVEALVNGVASNEGIHVGLGVCQITGQTFYGGVELRPQCSDGGRSLLPIGIHSRVVEPEACAESQRRIGRGIAVVARGLYEGRVFQQELSPVLAVGRDVGIPRLRHQPVIDDVNLRLQTVFNRLIVK